MKLRRNEFCPIHRMALYNEVLPEFHRFNAELLGISVDGVCAMPHFPAITISTSRCALTSNLKERWRSFTRCSATEMDSPSALSS